MILFKIIEDTQKEMIALDEAIYSDDQWFDKLDKKAFSIKHKALQLPEGRRENLMMLNQEGQVPRRDQTDHQGHQSHHQREAQSEASIKLES